MLLSSLSIKTHVKSHIELFASIIEPGAGICMADISHFQPKFACLQWHILLLLFTLKDVNDRSGTGNFVKVDALPVPDEICIHIQGFVEDQFGLGLIARAVEEGISVIKPAGIMIFNMGGRPGQGVCRRLFERRGVRVTQMWQTKILQVGVLSLKVWEILLLHSGHLTCVFTGCRYRYLGISWNWEEQPSSFWVFHGTFWRPTNLCSNSMGLREGWWTNLPCFIGL